jgi:hypothetical protein
MRHFRISPQSTIAIHRRWTARERRSIPRRGSDTSRPWPHLRSNLSSHGRVLTMIPGCAPKITSRRSSDGVAGQPDQSCQPLATGPPLGKSRPETTLKPVEGRLTRAVISGCKNLQKNRVTIPLPAFANDGLTSFFDDTRLVTGVHYGRRKSSSASRSMSKVRQGTSCPGDTVMIGSPDERMTQRTHASCLL